jgi:3-oxoacyl-[acyl-carrier protein] reductase
LVNRKPVVSSIPVVRAIAVNGIGRACAAHFATAGDRVFITGRRAKLLDEVANSIGAISVAFDAADPHAVASALDKLPDRIDVLVNNAGGNTDLAHTDSADMGEGTETEIRLAQVASRWYANFDANVLTAVLVSYGTCPLVNKLNQTLKSCRFYHTSCVMGLPWLKPPS